MTQFEYKVVPAPARGEKAKGVRSAEDRFAHAVESLMNRMAAEGWEYQRAEMLPSEERQGLTSTTTHWHNLLVFRRPRRSSPEAFKPRLLGAPAPEAQPPVATGATRMLRDNGVEEPSDVAGMTNALLMRAAQTRRAGSGPDQGAAADPASGGNTPPRPGSD